MNGALLTLRDRGFIAQCTNLDELDRMLESGGVTFYCGFDPTGPSLQAGHLIPLFAMAHLSRAGHRPIALVGGGTALIGDPTGKTEMRLIQSKSEIEENAARFRGQIARFVEPGNGGSSMLNNAEWLSGLKVIDFLREVGRHFSVNRMLSFETYKARLETGLSFIEFNYQILQSFDFLHLYRTHGCRLQIGGDDQWGNIVAGADLIRRVESIEAIGMTFPLITTADGKKMGKTEKGALFLDPEMTPPFELFQYFRNVDDKDVLRYLKLFTFLEMDAIAEFEHLEGAELNAAKERLAFELTKIVHGEKEAEMALNSARGAFSQSGADTSAIPSIEIDQSELAEGVTAVELFSRTDLCASKGEARRLIEQGGARIDETKVGDINELVGVRGAGDVLTLRAGKKRLFRVILR